MFRRGYVFAALGTLAAVSVVGAGFSIWAFNDSAEATHDMGVHITQSTMLGSFTVPEIRYAVLDGGTGAGINPTITGISFYKSEMREGSAVAVTDNAFVIVFKVGDGYTDFIKTGDNANNLKFGIRIEVPAALEGVITHTDFYNDHMTDDGYIDLKALTVELTDHFSDPDYDKSDFSFDESTCEYSFSLTTTTLNRFFTYAATKEPNTLEKQNELSRNYASQFVIELWQG